jgi:UDP-N-acetylglucosamine--N-acetylmuramyl-(pentapeptide) pyrophosphoryl-undecaprenol N-acetylglucosamine transferase
MEAEIIRRLDIAFESIPAAGLHGVSLKTIPGNLNKLIQGYKSSKKLINNYHPDVIFYTGGYIAVPMAFSAPRVPSLVFIPDIEPGLALKVLLMITRNIAVSVQDTKKYLSSRSNVAVTGYPVRDIFNDWTVDEAYETFNLSPTYKTLLVIGGSSGARSINRALLTSLPELLNKYQVIHVSGKLDWNEVSLADNSLTKALRDKYRPFPYLHEEIGAAMLIADLAVSRAGASILGELPHFGLPAIVVPYPHAWRYQKTNAEYLAKRDAAVIIEDGKLNTKLLPGINNLMDDDDLRARMRKSMESINNPGSADKIALILEKLATN